MTRVCRRRDGALGSPRFSPLGREDDVNEASQIAPPIAAAGHNRLRNVYAASVAAMQAGADFI